MEKEVCVSCFKLFPVGLLVKIDGEKECRACALKVIRNFLNHGYKWEEVKPFIVPARV